MAELFEISELVKVAVEDERTGVVFYSKLAEKSEHLRETFAELASAEEFHLAQFQEMLSELGGVQSREQYPGEYMAYLQALTTERAFPDEATAIRMAEECDGDAEAIQLANRFERDTLVLLNEMRKLVPDKHSAIVDKIAQEEQAHLVTLTEAREKLN